MIPFGYNADRASLHWNNWSYRNGKTSETAIADGDEDSPKKEKYRSRWPR